MLFRKHLENQANTIVSNACLRFIYTVFFNAT